MNPYVDVIIRSIIAFFSIFFAARILGKQTVSRMTIFDFIAVVTLGSVTANLAFALEVKARYIFLVFFIFVLLIYLSAFLSLKSKRARKYVAGDPTVVIENGKILEHNMRKMRYTLDYLNQQLRQKDIFSIDDVDYALVENNGLLSVKKKEAHLAVTRKDLHIFKEEVKLPIELMMDGEILLNNLKENNISKEWLFSELKKRNLTIESVVYALLTSNNKLYIDIHDDKLHSPMDVE
ncbi:DUF421 domain-containing protein [Fictibacillus sp. 7GRE50]|uniref:DUF421 domain-containing protein n=1 Tax=Fictibacillus TaxID=1329200 RepID=UPI0018CE268C|nr:MULTISPECIES: DUF421 domain-containing protein [unclassified Fictibacillus]MBH0165574.1 DUF421 domain-containing protein [Fictibacillus sp. 7GRE50]MBH0173373.1 DUF421 domain-containing protein [Fictibacillus sp. 23RED33]